MSSRGFTLVGRGFVVDAEEAGQLRNNPAHLKLVRPYRNGRDLAATPRGLYVIDFGTRDEEQARGYPVLYDLLRTRVKPQRDANNDRPSRENWWKFGRNREDFREALSGLPRYIATPYVAKHSFFQFLDTEVAPDEKLVCIASADAFLLGVLSSSIHVSWALAAGSRLGIGDDPTYNNSLCFDPFPFPDANEDLRSQIADVAERLNRHRRDALARDERLTVTGMYNVLERLRSNEALTAKERGVHESAACGVLRDLHDELDRLVAEAYGWPWPLPRAEILERLVALHDERVAEERAGQVHWLRPDYQIPRFAPEQPGTKELDLPTEVAASDAGQEVAEWPATMLEQIGALKAAVAEGPIGVREAARRFKGARQDIVERHLETLALLGEVQLMPDGRYHAPAVSAVAA